MPPALYLPRTAGLAALAELPEVPWSLFDHCYTEAPPSDALHRDVARSLRALGDPDPQPAIHALFSNVYHQRTVYPATAQALPFVIAVAGDPAFAARAQLFVLVLGSALSSCLETEDGTSAGAYGEGTGESIRAGLRASLSMLRTAAALDPILPPCIAPLEQLLAEEEPSREAWNAVRAAITALEDEVRRRFEAAQEAELAPVRSQATAGRYRHAKFGDATLVEALEGDRLRLRFDDGAVRVLVARFVIPL